MSVYTDIEIQTFFNIIVLYDYNELWTLLWIVYFEVHVTGKWVVNDNSNSRMLFVNDIDHKKPYWISNDIVGNLLSSNVPLKIISRQKG